MYSILRIASRNLPLDKIQTYSVFNAIKTIKQGKILELDFRESEDVPAFLDSARKDLLNERIDLLVTSYSELGAPVKGLCSIPVLRRLDRRDIFLIKQESLPKTDWKVYTPSLRRYRNLEQFLAIYAPLSQRNKTIHSIPLEGNLLRGLEAFASSNADGILLCKADLHRVLSDDYPQSREEELVLFRNLVRNVLEQCKFFILPLSIAPNLPGAGSIGVEFRDSRDDLNAIFRQTILYNSLEEIERERDDYWNAFPDSRKDLGVSFLKRNYGLIRYAKVSLPESAPSSEIKLQASHQPKVSKKESLFPLPDDIRKFARKPLKISEPPSGNLFVTRFDAWLPHWKRTDSILWSAGLGIYKKLADLDLWVCGTSEGLGEEEDPDLAILLKDPSFTKLTHTRCEGIPSKYKKFYTYDLEIPAYPDLTLRTHFFWTSGLFFDEAIRKYPKISACYHASTPGITKNYIQKKIGKPIDTFLSYESWFEYHTGIMLAGR